MDILFEDNHVLVVNKPAGLASQKTAQGTVGAEDLMKDFIKQRDNKQGNVFLHTVHRLDGTASGILLLAKSAKALSRLSEAVRERRLKKIYMAIVEGGQALYANQILIDFMAHGAMRAIKSSENVGQKAELKILQKKELGNNKTLLVIKLITGRYHQIRFQLAQRAFPIVGDVKYGSKSTYGEGKIMLHHTYLSFPHPTIQKDIEIVSWPSWKGLEKEIAYWQTHYSEFFNHGQNNRSLA